MEQGSPGNSIPNYRASKRTRESETTDSETADPMMQDQVLGQPTLSAPAASFRDKLMSTMNLTKNIAIEVDSLEEDFADLNDEEDVVTSRGDRGPSIQFSERAMSRLCQPWKNALIIKLLGRSHTYNFLHTKLQQKWNLKGDWKLIDLINDYFVVKFELEEDLNFVLTGGPWVIAGQYLIMQKWRPGFCPASARVTRMAVWIRVAAIQLECFDVWALKRIGNLLGKLLKIDTLTTTKNRGKFARLCVELDLTKPLEAFVQINQTWYNIEYEGLPDICYGCGLYGHKRDSCNLMEKVPAEQPGSSADSVDANPKGNDATSTTEHTAIPLETLRGPWMNVPPRRKPKATLKEGYGSGSSVKTHGSRYDALGQLDDCTEKDHTAPSTSVGLNKGEKVFDPLFTKVWTKTKKQPIETRTGLKGLPVKLSTGHVKASGSSAKPGRTGSFSPEMFNAKGKEILGGKLKENPLTIDAHLSNWGKGHEVNNGKGIYIFGHQPPNIVGDDSREEERIDPLAHPLPNGDSLGDKMDLLVGQKNYAPEDTSAGGGVFMDH